KLFDTVEEDVIESPPHTSTPQPSKPAEEKAATSAPTRSPSDASSPSENSNAMYTLLLKLKKKNHFELLGVQKEAATSQIERAYHLLCKQHHLGQIDQFYQGEEIEHAKQL